MKHALDLFSFEGRVGRRQYLAAGAALFALKYVLDTGVAMLFGQPWNPLMYLSPRVSPLLHPAERPAYWIALLAVALPFIAAGLSLSARRLRDMGRRPLWCGLFFVPFLHWVFFLVLSVVPAAEAGPAPSPAEADPDDGGPLIPALARLLPDSTSGRFLLALGVSVAIAGLGLASVMALPPGMKQAGPLPSKEVLGVGLFFGIPFGIGFWSAFIVGYRRPAGDFVVSLLAALAALAIGLFALMAIAIEGVACIVMATPILTPITILGAVVGHLCARSDRPAPAVIASLLLVSGLLADDRLRPPAAVELVHTTELRVAARPEVVFRHVGRVSPIDEPPEAIFAICAMPLESRLEGEGVGARRSCVLTIGDVDEVVTVSEPGRALEFAVTAAPARFARYGALERGRFDLIDEGDGTTILRGTTWYRMRVAPAWYWSLWTQSFVGAVQRRVMSHVKRLAEDPTAPEPTKPAEQPAWMSITNATCSCTRHARPGEGP